MSAFTSFLPRHAAAGLLAICLPLALAGEGVPGVRNFQTVDAHVLRGGQPTAEGFQNLASRGVKTVVDLRGTGNRSRAEKKLVESLGMHYVGIPMKGMHTPSEEQISRALAVLKSDTAAPVFVHCRRGADRTGAVVACYRVEHDQWDNAKALREARGHGMSWYQFQLARYVLSYKAHGESQKAETAGASQAGGVSSGIR
jgi:tyrosine-protein phosphatase SIW14